MRSNSILAAIAVMTLTVTVSPSASFAQYGAPPQGPPPGYQQGPPPAWDTPPQEFREYQARGYHDGVVGATKDYENHRPPSPENRDEFRHPSSVPRPFRRDYKDGFRKGYFAAVQHMQGGPGPYQGPR